MTHPFYMIEKRISPHSYIQYFSCLVIGIPVHILDDVCSGVVWWLRYLTGAIHLSCEGSVGVLIEDRTAECLEKLSKLKFSRVLLVC